MDPQCPIMLLSVCHFQGRSSQSTVAQCCEELPAVLLFTQDIGGGGGGGGGGQINHNSPGCRQPCS